MDKNLIIENIEILNQQEIEVIYLESQKRLSKYQKTLLNIDKYCNKKNDVWETDAQKYISKTREYERN